MISVENIVKNIVENLDLGVDIYRVDTLALNSFKCWTLNTQWLSTRVIFEMEGRNYKVTDFVINSFVTVSQVNGSTTPETGLKLLRIPYFIAAKLTQANSELLEKGGNTASYFPVVWLFNRQTRTRPAEASSVIDSDGNVRMFFLNEDSYGDFTAEQRRTQIIEPMNNLAESVYDALDNSPSTGLLGSTDFINHEKFVIGGDSVSKDDETNILTLAEFSGVELSVGLPIKISMFCATKETF